MQMVQNGDGSVTWSIEPSRVVLTDLQTRPAESVSKVAMPNLPSLAALRESRGDYFGRPQVNGDPRAMSANNRDSKAIAAEGVYLQSQSSSHPFRHRRAVLFVSTYAVHKRL